MSDATAGSLGGFVGAFIAGGTDLMERRRSGVTAGPFRELPADPAMRTIDGTRIGALVTVATLASTLADDYPALALAAAGLATPQIRRMATVGGNLLQHNRCWYYRRPDVDCLKKGGDACPARSGNHRYGALFDLGPCVAVHASTLAAALLTYDALVDTDRREGLTIADLLGDGRDGRRDHQLAPDELLVAIRLPAPMPDERGGYVRAISRAYAEWPLVEASVRLGIHSGQFGWAAVAVGGVAPVPLRLRTVEQALIGRPVTAATIAAASSAAADGAAPLPGTAYKAQLLVGTVAEAIERALR